MAAPLIEPSVRQRFESLDVVRGIAIFGILLANIAAFAGSELGPMLGKPYELVGTDRAVDLFGIVLVSGKFRTMLAILFGAGICLQFVKRWEAGGSWPGTYLRRVLFLGLLGAIHSVLLWYGDILWPYAWLALFTVLLARIGEGKQRVIIWIGCTIAIILGLLSFAGGFFEGGQSTKIPFIGDEAQIFSEGSYLEQVGFRFTIWLMMSLFYLAWAPGALALFLVGFLLARHGVLTHPQDHPKTLKKMAAIGIGLGLPLNLLVLVFWQKGNISSASGYVELVAGPVLSIGYLALILHWVVSGKAHGIARQVAKVGKMALSNYLLQTLVCTTIFYSWGFGLFDQLTELQALAVVPLVWTINVLFTNFWLARFQLGPVEWAWRSLSEKRRFPIRRSTEPESAA